DRQSCRLPAYARIHRPRLRLLGPAGTQRQPRNLRLGHPGHDPPGCRKSAADPEQHRRDRSRACGDRGLKTATLISHGESPSTSAAIAQVVELASAAGWRIVAEAEELERHGDAAKGIAAVERLPQQADLCL